MKYRTTLTLIVVLCALPLVAATCLSGEGGQRTAAGAKKIGDVVQTIAPALPPPFNWLLAGGGAILALVGGHFAAKQRASMAQPQAASPVLKVLSERKWLFPILGALVSSLRAADVLPISDSDLAAILTMLGIPTAGEFLKDALAKQPERPPMEVPKA